MKVQVTYLLRTNSFNNPHIYQYIYFSCIELTVKVNAVARLNMFGLMEALKYVFMIMMEYKTALQNLPGQMEQSEKVARYGKLLKYA